MRLVRLALAVCLLASLLVAQAPPREIRQTQIAEGIYIFATAEDGYVNDLNTVVMINDSDVVVYDTQTRPSSARWILSELRKLTDKPVRYVVNSHWHPDHWSGNEVFAEAFPGVAIVATEEAAGYMRYAAPPWNNRFKINTERAEAAIAEAIKTGKQEDGIPFTAEQRQKDEAELALYKDFAAEQLQVKRTYPTLTYTDRLTLRSGSREFQLISLVGDAVGTTVVYLPKEKVVMTGDVVVHPIPYSTPAPRRRIADLKRLRALDWNILIPGHGPIMRDRAYLDLQIELLGEVVNQVRAALENGAATLDDVKKQVKMDSVREKFAKGDKDLAARFDGHVAFLIPQAIREAREQDYR